MMCQGCVVIRCTVLCFAKSEWASKLHTAVLHPYFRAMYVLDMEL